MSFLLKRLVVRARRVLDSAWRVEWGEVACVSRVG